MLAEIRDRDDVAPVPEDRDALAAGAHDPRTAVGDLECYARIDPAVGHALRLDVTAPFLQRRRDVERDEPRESERGRDRKDGPDLGPQRPEGHVRDEKGIGHVDAHVKRFPDRCREVGEPEVVARRRHQEEDAERDQAQRLESRVAAEQAHERRHDPERVELDGDQSPVSQPDEEGRDAQMTAVVEKRQPPRVETAQGADRQDDVEQDEGEGAEASDEDRLDRCRRMEQESDADEECEVGEDAPKDRRVVELLRAVPPDRAVRGTHRCSAGSSRDGGASLRPAKPNAITSGSAIASTIQTQRWIRRRPRVTSATSAPRGEATARRLRGARAA
jgi:hypothetical protein